MKSVQIPPACYRSSHGRVLSHCSKIKLNSVHSVYKNELLSSLAQIDGSNCLPIHFGINVDLAGVVSFAEGLVPDSDIYPLSVPVSLSHERHISAWNNTIPFVTEDIWDSQQTAVLGADVLVVAGGLDATSPDRQNFGVVVNGLLPDSSAVLRSGVSSGESMLTAGIRVSFLIEACGQNRN